MENLSKFYKGKKILITGHTGFKGSWLSQILVLWGAEVVGISLKPNTNPNLFNLLDLKNSIKKNYFADIRNFKKIEEIFRKEKPEIVFHLAAQPIVRDSYDNPLYTFQTNVLGTANVLESIRNNKGVRVGVMITTDKVYHNSGSSSHFVENDKLGGSDPYSGSKASAEMVIVSYIKSFFSPLKYGKQHRTLISSARAGNVIGGGDWAKDRIIPDLVRAAMRDKNDLIVRNLESVRPWQFVLEPLLGYLILAKNLYKGKTNIASAYNFGPSSANFLTVKELLNESFAVTGFGSYVVKKDDTKHEDVRLTLNSNLAKDHFGWGAVIPVKETIIQTINWYKNYYSGGDVVEFTNKQINNFFKYALSKL